MGVGTMCAAECAVELAAECAVELAAECAAECAVELAAERAAELAAERSDRGCLRHLASPDSELPKPGWCPEKPRSSHLLVRARRLPG
jgi:hypothetical protein